VSAVAFEFGESKRPLVASFVELAALDSLIEGSTSSWVNIAPPGEWLGHKQPIKFNADTFGQIVRNFDRLETPPCFDYEHDSMKSDVLGPKPASGFIKKLELRSDGTGLWGFVEWTPRAAKMIRDGEYRFCSPVVDFDFTDRKTGEPSGAAILNVALTNNPFLDGQRAIQLSMVAAMAAEEKPMPDMTEEEKQAAADKEAKDDKPAEDAAAMSDGEAEAKPEAEAVDAEAGTSADASAAVDLLAKATNMDAQAVIAALMDRADDFVALLQKSSGVAQMRADAEKSETELRFMRVELERKDKQIAAMSSEMSRLTGDNKSDEAARIKDHVVKLTASGHIGDSDAEQADAIALFSADFERASRVYSTQKVPVGFSQASAGAAGAEGGRSTVVRLSQLDGADHLSARMLMRAGWKEDSAVAQVVALRGGKGN
jgi:phage I-like protein